MKVRLDFVTNSSSTSFLVAVKGEIDKTNLLNVFGVPEDSPLRGVAVSVVDFLVSEAELVDLEAELADWGYEAVEAALEDGFLVDEIDLNRQGYTLYQGCASYNEYDTHGEAVVANCNFDYDSPELVLRSGGVRC